MVKLKTATLVTAACLIVAAHANAGESVIHGFGTGAQGAFPAAAPLLSGGVLYGTTESGTGTNSHSTAWSLQEISGVWTFTVLHNFPLNPSGSDGYAALGGLAADSSGNLYGTTQNGGGYCNGGTASCGTVYELSQSGGVWTETVLYSFEGGSDGDFPSNTPLVVEGSTVTLYGTTSEGGNTSHCGGAGCGTIWALVRNSDGTWTKTTLHSFTGGSDGAWPAYDKLVADSSGVLYGTTSGFGTLGSDSTLGTVYSLSYSGGVWTETALYGFAGGTADGANPYGGVVISSSGALYGTTRFGGTANTGTVFKLVNSGGSWNETPIHLFANSTSDVSNPVGTLYRKGGGELWGTGSNGGLNGYGGIFSLTPPSGGGDWTETLQYSFAGGSDGIAPTGGLALDTTTGYWFGTTPRGGGTNCSGSIGCGTVFIFHP